jgi:hypothetical protein
MSEQLDQAWTEATQEVETDVAADVAVDAIEAESPGMDAGVDPDIG